MDTKQDDQKPTGPITEMSERDTSSPGSSPLLFEPSKRQLSLSAHEEQVQAAGNDMKELNLNDQGKTQSAFKNQVGNDLDVKPVLKTDDLIQTNVDNSVGSKICNVVDEREQSDRRGKVKSAMTLSTHNEPSTGLLKEASMPLSASGGCKSSSETRTSLRLRCTPKDQQGSSSVDSKQQRSLKSSQNQTPLLTFLSRLSGNSSKIPKVTFGPETSSNSGSSGELKAIGHRSTLVNRHQTPHVRKLCFNQHSKISTPLSTEFPSLEINFDKNVVLTAEKSQDSPKEQEPSEELFSVLAGPSVATVSQEEDNISTATKTKMVAETVDESAENSVQAPTNSSRESENGSPSTPKHLIRHATSETIRSRKTARKQSAQSLLKTRRKLPFDVCVETESNSPDFKGNVERAKEEARASSSSLACDLFDNQESQIIGDNDPLGSENFTKENGQSDDLIRELPSSDSNGGLSAKSRTLKTLEGDEPSTSGTTDVFPLGKASGPPQSALIIRKAPFLLKSSINGTTQVSTRKVPVPPVSSKLGKGDVTGKIRKPQPGTTQCNAAKVHQSTRESKLLPSKSSKDVIPRTNPPPVKRVLSNTKLKSETNESQVKTVGSVLKSRQLDVKPKMSSGTNVTKTTSTLNPKLQTSNKSTLNPNLRTSKKPTGYKDQAVEAVRGTDKVLTNSQSVGVQTDPVFISNCPATDLNVETLRPLQTRSVSVPVPSLVDEYSETEFAHGTIQKKESLCRSDTEIPLQPRTHDGTNDVTPGLGTLESLNSSHNKDAKFENNDASSLATELADLKARYAELELRYFDLKFECEHKRNTSKG